MATKKISEFTTLGSLSDSDILPVVNAGSNKKITGATLKTYAQSGLTIPTDVSDLTDTTSLLGGSGGVGTLDSVTDTGSTTTNGITVGSVTLTNGAVIRDTEYNAVAFGNDAGKTNQGLQAVAVGINAGYSNQGVSAVAIGVTAGMYTQGTTAVAIGIEAGKESQGVSAVAIGAGAGKFSQGVSAVAIGDEAGAGSEIETPYFSGGISPSTTLEVYDTTGIIPGMVISGTGFTGGQTVVTVTNATTVEISASANSTPSGELTFTSRQGANAVAIGNSAGQTTQAANTIILNATGVAVNGVAAQTDSFYVAPIRNATGTHGVLQYNTTTNEVTYSNEITINNSTWTFGTDGKLTAPGNLQVDGGKIILNSAGNAYVESVDYGVNSANSAVNIFGGPYQKIKLRAGFGTEATWTFGTDGTLTLPSGGAVDGNFVNGQWLDVFLTAPEGATKTAGIRDFFGKTVAVANENYFLIETNRAISTKSWTFGPDGDLTAPRNIILNNPVTTVTESVTGTVADSNGNPFTFRILKADNPQLITPFADPNFVLKWTGTDAGSVAAGTQAPGGQGPSSLVSDDGTYWNFNSWFGLNTSRPNTGTVFTVEYGVVHSDTMISTTATNLVIEADTEQWKFGTDGVLTLPDNSVIASYKPVTVIAGPTGVQTISDNASATRLTFIESVDSVGAFTNSTFTVPYTGYYQFNATVYFTSNVTLTDGFLVIVNTTSGLNELDTLYYGAHTGRVINGSSMQYLTAGDTVALFFRQVSGNGVDIGSSSRLTIHRVSIS